MKNQRKLWTTLDQIATAILMINTDEEPFQILESRVLDLLELANKLSNENRALRSEQKKWSIERSELTKKNELAKAKLEKLLTRLKGMR